MIIGWNYVAPWGRGNLRIVMKIFGDVARFPFIVHILGNNDAIQ